ncbi:membrane protein [Devosia pacifica]|uniref:Membrane protein n=1 Tax=Devosia pacifica TaxID=1335967 RepID=A0A918S731_9HYPH|nr:flagellar motor protein MotB [Devosia pacifica]GHA26936.1 membrane protein [Devosia pacifica]
MARKKEKSGGEIPEWLVTFSDLMSILVCFFVLIISFSIQDEARLQVVAGSMRDAFGTTQIRKPAGVIEQQGNPQREFLKQPTEQRPDPDRDQAFAEEHLKDTVQGPAMQTQRQENTIEQDRSFALAAASIRQAWQDMPDLTQVADNLIVEETEEGLDIVIADQQGRPMFPEGSKYPFEVTRKAIAAIAPILQQLPNQVRISGHTAAGSTFSNPRYGAWELSTDRANTVRQILGEFGLASERMHSVVGRANGEPFFPNDPYLAANERVKITLLQEAPPVPTGLSP